ncbi:hypothetical protein P7K49_010453, partial [Saguinus oedipus]
AEGTSRGRGGEGSRADQEAAKAPARPGAGAPPTPTSSLFGSEGRGCPAAPS